MSDTFICPKVKWMEKKKMSFNDILVPDSITIKAKKIKVSELWLMELDLIELLNCTI